MNWIAAWLKARCEYQDKTPCIDCARMCAAKNSFAEGTGCSHALIGILISGGITHPAIANDIAEFTGATPQQRDQIVHRMHRGKWKKPKPKSEKPKKPKPERKLRKVIALDKLGREIRRYASLAETAAEIGVSTTTIQRRCACDFEGIKDEFASLGMTFRYADAWDAMTDKQKMENIQLCTGK